MDLRRPLPPFTALALAVLPVAIAGFAGSAATLPNIPGWYAGLAKPSFTPPNAVFGPVWTTLYILMAYAAWRIWRNPQGHEPRAVVAYLVQAALNGAWSIVFFGLHRPGAALIVLGALWAAIVWTMILFGRRDRLAGALLLPYLAWSSFAAALNAAIWRLN